MEIILSKLENSGCTIENNLSLITVPEGKKGFRYILAKETQMEEIIFSKAKEIICETEKKLFEIESESGSECQSETLVSEFSSTNTEKSGSFKEEYFDKELNTIVKIESICRICSTPFSRKHLYSEICKHKYHFGCVRRRVIDRHITSCPCGKAFSEFILEEAAKIKKRVKIKK